MPDEFGLPDDQQEDFEDLGEAGRRYQAVINLADWTVETIVGQIDKHNIALDPAFQRREAWRNPRKSQYIESLILNVPVPQIVLAERKDDRGRFIVIDGKQRLLSLRQFCSIDGVFDAFTLRGLSIRTDLNGVSFRDLCDNPLLIQDRNALLNSTIRTAVIRNWEDENFLYTIFLRLNTGSVPLSPQELRQALHPGRFVEFVDQYSREGDLLHAVMGLDRPDPRMRDAELVIRYYAFRNFLDTYSGNLKPLLDRTAEYFNNQWDAQYGQIEQQRLDFENAIQASTNIFGIEAAFRKWNGTRYEHPLNRAIFDVLIYYFVEEDVRHSAEAQPQNVRSAFEDLCGNDVDFRSSIEGTTKSIEAIYTRLRLWGEALRHLNIPARSPTLVGNKITRG